MRTARLVSAANVAARRRTDFCDTGFCDTGGFATLGFATLSGLPSARAAYRARLRMSAIWVGAHGLILGGVRYTAAL
jgi:hypothetical protein